MNYYYLAASLPGLSFDSPPPLSVEAFSRLCREHLSRADQRALRETQAGGRGPVSSRFARAWERRETRLRNALVRARAARLKRDPLPHLRPQDDVDTAVDKAVAEAFSRETPLAREQALDRFRWTQAEALAGYNPFAVEAILAYALRLGIAARWAGLAEETGQARAEEIVGQTPRAEATGDHSEGAGAETHGRAAPPSETA
jgi:hypothetical protein